MIKYLSVKALVVSTVKGIYIGLDGGRASAGFFQDALLGTGTELRNWWRSNNEKFWCDTKWFW